MRKNSGVAIYVRNGIKVKEVSRADQYELISLKLELQSGNTLLVIGMYHPPKALYSEQEPLSYITNIVDDFVDDNSSGLVVWGGDVNALDKEQLAIHSGLRVLVNFPTRKE